MLGPRRELGMGSLPDLPELPQGDDTSSSVANDFFMYIFKVQPCPKRGAHDWSSCPYAHPKEKARRRDPRVYKYASTPCPESLKGVSCGRGVQCQYAHSVYEYWLHPSRFRTQMCKKGNQCNRTLCFFAHSASELRFPDTSDDLEAAAVDAAAASATAGTLPLVTPGSQIMAQPGMMMVTQPTATNSSSSSFGTLQGLVGLNQVCRDGSYGGLVRVPSGMQQQDASACGLGGTDPMLRIPGVAAQPAEANSLSDPLPRLGNEGIIACQPGSSAWLQMAAASQLPASQILSSIRPPAPQQLQMQQHAVAVMNAAAVDGYAAAAAAAAAAGVPQEPASLQRMSAPPNMLMHWGGQPAVDATADRLTASLAGMSLVDDSSGSSCLTAISGDQQYLAALNACAAAAAAGHPVDLNTLQGVASPPHGNGRVEDYVLLQQQQQLVKLGSGNMAGSCGVAANGRQSSGGVYVGLPAGNGVQQGNGTWGMRMY